MLATLGRIVRRCRPPLRTPEQLTTPQGHVESGADGDRLEANTMRVNKGPVGRFDASFTTSNEVVA